VTLTVKTLSENLKRVLPEAAQYRFVSSVNSALDKRYHEVDAVLHGWAQLRRDGYSPDSVTGMWRISKAHMASLYVQRKVENAGTIIAFYEKQGLQNLEPASELHVTLIYNRTEVDWDNLTETYHDKLRILSGPRFMERFGMNRDYLVLRFAASELRWRNEELRESIGGGDSEFKEYRPHITIAKGLTADVDITLIEPYLGVIVLSPEIFETIDTD
jgi:hypothetical protein